MIDEFHYPPRVQEALDLVENASKEYERRERQAERRRRQIACLHFSITTIAAATMEDPTLTITTCDICGATLSELR